MLLILAFIFAGAAVFAFSEAATYPARLKARSIKRATEYGRVRIPTREQELLRFRERVVAPLALKLAKIPLRLSPKTNLEAVKAKLVAAGLAQRLSPGGFLAVKGGITVGGCLSGLVLGGIASPVAGFLLTPILVAVG